MDTIILFLIISFIPENSCSFASLLDEWSEIMKDPPVGYGSFTYIPLYMEPCEPSFEVDQDNWVNLTAKIVHRKDDKYDIIIDAPYRNKIRINKIKYESWSRIRSVNKLLIKYVFPKPCSTIMTKPAIVPFNPTSSCEIFKNNYHLVYEDVDRYAHMFVQFFPYMRVLNKFEYFSKKGQIGCSVLMADFMPKKK